MGLGGFLKDQFIDVIEFVDDSPEKETRSSRAPVWWFGTGRLPYSYIEGSLQMCLDRTPLLIIRGNGMSSAYEEIEGK